MCCTIEGSYGLYNRGFIVLYNRGLYLKNINRVTVNIVSLTMSVGWCYGRTFVEEKKMGEEGEEREGM